MPSSKWGDVQRKPAREVRLLILLIACAGFRWTEAVSLSVTDVGRDRARLSVQRVLAWSPDDQTWDLEDVKGCIAATVPLPEPLWRALMALAASRPVEDRLGGDLLFRPLKVRRLGVPTMIIDHTDWIKRVWHPARAAAGLIGDPTLPTLDPRRRIDALWTAWASALPAGAGALDPDRPEPVAPPPDRIEAHEDAPGDRAAEKKGPKKGPLPLLTPSSTALESEKTVALKRQIAGGSPGFEPLTYGLKAFPITPQTTEY